MGWLKRLLGLKSKLKTGDLVKSEIGAFKGTHYIMKLRSTKTGDQAVTICCHDGVEFWAKYITKIK